MTLEQQKKEMRRYVKDNVQKLEELYCKQADQHIFEYVTGLLEYNKAETIFCYVGTSAEIDTIPILKDALKKGKRVGVPRCVAKGVMQVYQIECLDDLKEGRYGILEPYREAVPISPEEIQIGIIPCVTCTRDGKRLGYGGGYYDRYLEHTKFLRVILCREKIMEEWIPTGVFDQRMDVVISENGVTRIEKMEQ